MRFLFLLLPLLTALLMVSAQTHAKGSRTDGIGRTRSQQSFGPDNIFDVHVNGGNKPSMSKGPP